jgi:hypothetical protein
MLTEFQNWHLKMLLDGLDDVINKLQPNQKKFVEETNVKYVEFEQNTRLSPKQLNWLEGLYKQYVGPLD